MHNPRTHLPHVHLCVCVNLCIQIGKYRICGSCPPSAARRKASKINSEITTTNRQQVTPKPATDRAQTPEQRPRAGTGTETETESRPRPRVPTKAPTTRSCRRSQRAASWQQQVNVKLIKRQCTVGPRCSNTCVLFWVLGGKRIVKYLFDNT